MLENGAEADAKDSKGQTAMFMTTMTTLLNPELSAALSRASMSGKEAVARLLLDNGAKIRGELRAPNGKQFIMLHAAQ